MATTLSLFSHSTILAMLNGATTLLRSAFTAVVQEFLNVSADTDDIWRLYRIAAGPTP